MNATTTLTQGADDGRQLKYLTVVDEFTRQGLAIRIGRSLTASDVTRILEQLFHEHGNHPEK